MCIFKSILILEKLWEIHSKKKKKKALVNFQEEYSHKQLERQKTWNIISKLKNRGQNQSVYNSLTISTIGDQLIVWVSYPKKM